MRPRTSRATEALILHMAEGGILQTTIAKDLAVSEGQVSKIIHQYADTREMAKRLLQKGSATLAQRAISKANVAESIDILERIDVLKPKAVHGSGSSQVNILIGMPNQPIGPDPIDLSPLVFAEPSVPEPL